MAIAWYQHKNSLRQLTTEKQNRFHKHATCTPEDGQLDWNVMWFTRRRRMQRKEAKNSNSPIRQLPTSTFLSSVFQCWAGVNLKKCICKLHYKCPSYSTFCNSVARFRTVIWALKAKNILRYQLKWQWIPFIPWTWTFEKYPLNR